MTCLLPVLLFLWRLCERGMSAAESNDLESCGPDALTVDQADCHVYTQCFAGRLYRFSCGPNSAFDVAAGACVSASLVAGCDSTGSTVSPQNEFVCQFDGYYPEPADCRRFFWCSGGINHPFSCPDDLAFDVTSKTCRQQDNVMSCQTSVTTPMTHHSSPSLVDAVTPGRRTETALQGSGRTHSGELKTGAVIKKDAKQSGTFAANSAIETPTSSEGVEMSRSAKRNTTEDLKLHKIGVQLSTPQYCEPETLKRDPADCHQFYLCGGDGTSYRFRCPRDLVFSAASGLCETRDKVPECDNTGDQYNFDCPTSNGFFRDKSDCRQFFHCVDGVARALQCPYGFVFNPVYNLCDIPERVGNCHSQTSEASVAATTRNADIPCVWIGRFRHPFDCRQYYECRRSNPTATLNECPVGLVFNAWSEECDRVFNVPECFTYLVEGAQLDGLPYEAVVLSQASRRPAVTFGVVLPSEETFVCPRRGYFASLRSCFTYYRCEAAGDAPTERYCAGEFVFNARTSNCDYADNVPGCEAASKTTLHARQQYPTDTVSRSRTTSPRVYTRAQHARGEDNMFHHVLTESADSTSVSRVSYLARLGRTKVSINTNIRCGQESVFPDPADCRRYFHCQRHNLFHVTCGYRLVFNRRRYRCDDQLTSEVCQTPGDGERTHGDSPTDVVHGEIVKVTSKTTEELNECRRTGYQRSLADCTVFYYCSESIVYELRCADGLAFNVEHLRCIKRKDVRGC